MGEFFTLSFFLIVIHDKIVQEGGLDNVEISQ